MKNGLFHKLFDLSFLKYLAIGIFDTIIGMSIMFGLYNLAGWGYWASSVSNYVLTSILSFFLNRYFTFQSREWSWKQVLRFAMTIATCYVIAYLVAQPIVRLIFSSAEETLRDNLAMLTGMCLFSVMNYLGQKFFTFQKRTDPEQKDSSGSGS